MSFGYFVSHNATHLAAFLQPLSFCVDAIGGSQPVRAYRRQFGIFGIQKCTNKVLLSLSDWASNTRETILSWLPVPPLIAFLVRQSPSIYYRWCLSIWCSYALRAAVTANEPQEKGQETGNKQLDSQYINSVQLFIGYTTALSRSCEWCQGTCSTFIYMLNWRVRSAEIKNWWAADGQHLKNQALRRKCKCARIVTEWIHAPMDTVLIRQGTFRTFTLNDSWICMF